MKLVRDLYCYFFHLRHHTILENSGLPRPLNIISYAWWCPRCDDGGRPDATLALGAALGITGP